MRVARYWRMKKQTYRLEGNVDNNGQKSIQERPEMPNIEAEHQTDTYTTVAVAKTVAA
jgi:hypothetical protein